MKKATLWGENFGMLMASASPGSALAYHLGQAEEQAAILRRSIRNDATAVPGEPAVGDRAREESSGATPSSLWDRLREALRRYAEWSFERERERYLTQYGDLHQVEARTQQRCRDALLSRAGAVR